MFAASAPKCLSSNAPATRASAARTRAPGTQRVSSVLRVSVSSNPMVEPSPNGRRWDPQSYSTAPPNYCIFYNLQLPLTWSYTQLWSRRRHTSKTVHSTCYTVQPKRTACPAPPARPTGPMDTDASYASPPRYTTTGERILGPKRADTPGCGTSAMGKPC